MFGGVNKLCAHADELTGVGIVGYREAQAVKVILSLQGVFIRYPPRSCSLPPRGQLIALRIETLS